MKKIAGMTNIVQYLMMTSSNGNIFRVTGHLCGEFTGPRLIPRTKASDADLWFFFDLRLNKRLSKQWWGWWFETLSHPLWRHRNGYRKSKFKTLIHCYMVNLKIKSMMTSSNWSFSVLPALCAGNSPVTDEFPAQRPVTRSFHVFFDLRLNKRLSKQSWGWRSDSHRAHYDVAVMIKSFHEDAMTCKRFLHYWPFVRVIHRSCQLIVAQWRHMATEIWVSIGSGNGLLPDGIKPLPKTNVDLSSVEGNFIRYTLNYESLKLAWKWLT